jgi:glycine/D-amino acid oxidase-like deaminating enzyme
MVRMDYGRDTLYMDLADKAIQGWRDWNQRWGVEMFHEAGLLVLTDQPIAPGSFEYETFALLDERGHQPQRIDSGTLTQRFVQWNAEKYVDGYYNPVAGWAEAGNVVARLAEEALACGVELRTGTGVAGLLEDESRVVGVSNTDGSEQRADVVVVTTGAWTPTLLPQLGDVMSPTGQPIFYFKPSDPEPFQAHRFPPWGADIPKTGWYGFPADQEGVVKVANHGLGKSMAPEDSRDLTPDDVSRCRQFLQESLPGLADAPLVNGRRCLYCDTWDGNFWIGRDPSREGLVVAAGGSGHGFKFAPVMGGVIADAVEGIDTPYTRLFAWRPRGERKTEVTRYLGE